MEPDLVAIKLTTTIWAHPPRPTELGSGIHAHGPVRGVMAIMECGLQNLGPLLWALG